MICTPHLLLFRWKIEKKEMGGACSTYGAGEAYTAFWFRNLMERNHLRETGADGRIMLRWIFSNWEACVWNGLIWLRIGKVGGHL
jgi:hypothetical protein